MQSNKASQRQVFFLTKLNLHVFVERGLYLVTLIVERKSVCTEGSGCLHCPMLGGLQVCHEDDRVKRREYEAAKRGQGLASSNSLQSRRGEDQERLGKAQIDAAYEYRDDDSHHPGKDDGRAEVVWELCDGRWTSCDDQEGDTETRVFDDVRKVREDAEEGSYCGQSYPEAGGGGDLVLKLDEGTHGPDVLLNELVDLSDQAPELVLHNVLSNIWVDVLFQVAKDFFIFILKGGFEIIIEFDETIPDEFCLTCVQYVQ